MQLTIRLTTLAILTLVFWSTQPAIAAESRANELLFEPNEQFPFGRPNPEAPPELTQFAFMIGKNDCSEERLNGASGEWSSSTRTWDAYYYLNGFAIRDGGRSGSAINGNIRIYDSVAEQWVVSFFAMPSFGSGIWRGGLEGENMVLRQEQKAPGTDLDGVSRLTFSNISSSGFNWDGEWVSADGSVIFPFWRIRCSKRDG